MAYDDDDGDDDDGDDGVHQERPCGDKDLLERKLYHLNIEYTKTEQQHELSLVLSIFPYAAMSNPAIAGGPYVLWRYQVQRWRSHFVW